LARDIRKVPDANNCSSGHLIMSLRYLVKYRTRSFTIYNNEFILDSAYVGSEMIN